MLLHTKKYWHINEVFQLFLFDTLRLCLRWFAVVGSMTDIVSLRDAVRWRLCTWLSFWILPSADPLVFFPSLARKRRRNGSPRRRTRLKNLTMLMLAHQKTNPPPNPPNVAPPMCLPYSTKPRSKNSKRSLVTLNKTSVSNAMFCVTPDATIFALCIFPCMNYRTSFVNTATTFTWYLRCPNIVIFVTCPLLTSVLTQSMTGD